MKRVPYARGVDEALKGVRTASQRALKGLNQAASQVMAKGDYAAAQALAAKGREIIEFQKEVEELRKRWRNLRKPTPAGAKMAVTPLWGFYEPLLKALGGLGGESQRAELETQVERLFGPSLQPGDREPAAAGKERWRAMIERARKHMVREGWLENRKDGVWRLTTAGKSAALNPGSARKGEEGNS